MANPTNHPVENVRDLLQTYWGLSTPLTSDELDWRIHELGTSSILEPVVFLEMGDHWYTETIGRTPRTTTYQEIYITPMDRRDTIVNRHDDLWALRKEIERIITNYRTSATGIVFIELIKNQTPKSWRIDMQWKPYEVDTICKWQVT